MNCLTNALSLVTEAMHSVFQLGFAEVKSEMGIWVLVVSLKERSQEGGEAR